MWIVYTAADRQLLCIRLGRIPDSLSIIMRVKAISSRSDLMSSCSAKASQPSATWGLGQGSIGEVPGSGGQVAFCMDAGKSPTPPTATPMHWVCAGSRFAPPRIGQGPSLVGFRLSSFHHI